MRFEGGCARVNLIMSKQRKAVFLIVAVIVMLMMSACASLSVDDRMDLAMQCEQDCDLLWEEYNVAAERADRRRAKRSAGDCGRDMILYCGHACTATRRHGEVAGYCVPKDSIFISW